MHPLETYLQEIAQIHFSGANVKELSFYPVLKDLLDAAGNDLNPKVRSILSLKNQGGGMPDGGLFTASQLRKVAANAIIDQVPERGSIEVKSPQENAIEVAQGEQVTGYAHHYGLVLVTNLREFVLVKEDSGKKPQILEQYSLAGDEAAFWQMARHPRAAAQKHGDSLMEFLKRALLTQAELTDPKDLAWFLASYARDAHKLIDAAGDLPALNSLRQSMQQALNMDFAEEKGEHFFRSTLVQTLFYGVFSAWVLWHHENPLRNESFDWRLSAYKLKVPIIQSLFHQLSDPQKLKALGITPYLDLTGATLNRVNREAFFAKFDYGQAVQYFYEPFLQAYDPELRKQLGVWYTPHEIVQYMVERVDRVLREELEVADGLADPNVYVLDPCCGTGAYPLEVLRRIARTMQEKGEDALLGYELKRAATQRVFGFELLPAPFVIAHLQAGLFLQQHGVPLENEERAGVYLTNSLTGWEPPKGPKQHLLLSELEAERDAAERIKQQTPILVILGNPPYNAYAGVAETEEEKEMVKVYKDGLIKSWGIKKFNLDELYVRFFRLAERQIVEQTKKGILCYISSFSYLSDPSFVVMRERLLNGFDKFWFDCLNGDSRETGKTTPDGLPDPSIFSTETNKEGIRVGTVIGLMVRKSNYVAKKEIRFRHFWGIHKRSDLLMTLRNPKFEDSYLNASPQKENRYSFRPAAVATHYQEWPKVVDLCLEYSNGLMEKRGGALMDFQKDALEKRMRAYYDPELNWEEFKSRGYGLSNDAARFEAKNTRMKIQSIEKFKPENLRRYLLRPYDIRWCYYSSVRPLWNEPRPSLWAQCWDNNAFFMTRPAAATSDEGVPFFFTQLLGDNDFQRGHSYYFPVRLRIHKVQEDLFSIGLTEIKANLSETARNYLKKLGFGSPDSDGIPENGLQLYELIWLHALAIGYSSAYLDENADGIRGDWPRIPLPNSKDTLIESAVLGKKIAVLLDTENPAPAVLNEPEYAGIATLSRVGGGQINPQQGDLALTAGWGHAQGNIVMPGQGKLAAHGKSLDIYLNDKVYWKNIPAAVWEYTIGGYQVIKKWLSYREKDILGRDLTVEEAREVTGMARRIAALIALQPALDENYRRVKENTAVL